MAGNKNSGRRPGGRDFSPRVRSMVDRVLEKLHDTGKAEKLLMEAMEEDFVGTLRAMAAYAPKQVDMSVDQTLQVDTTQLSREVLTEMFEEKARRVESGDKSLH